MFTSLKRLSAVLLLLAATTLADAQDQQQLRREPQVLPAVEDEDTGDFPAVEIVGGNEAPAFKYTKWMVGISDKSNDPNESPWCGGSYIGKNMVMTAAHCVNDIVNKPGSIMIQLNRHDFTNPNEKGIIMTVNKIIVHPKYNKGTASANDMAILLTNNGPDLSSYPVLDDGSYSSETAKRVFKIIGWGLTQDNGDQSLTLLQANVDLTAQATCKDLYATAATKGKIDASMICAARNGIDTCQGDSGGPMFVDRATPVIVGLTSWGNGCAGREPGVYARVSYLKAFINSVAKCPTNTNFSQGKCQ